MAEQSTSSFAREVEFKVSGMHCQSCEQALSILLRQHDAVESVDASAKSGNVRVRLRRDVDRSELTERIAMAGYEVQ